MWPSMPGEVKWLDNYGEDRARTSRNEIQRYTELDSRVESQL